jgi:hypothetical protein
MFSKPLRGVRSEFEAKPKRLFLPTSVSWSSSAKRPGILGRMTPFKRAYISQAETDALVKELRGNPEKVRRWAGLPSNATAEDIEHVIERVAARSDATSKQLKTS